MKPILLALSLCFAVACPAQSRPAVVATEFVTLSLDGNVPTYYYRHQEKIIKLEVSAQGIGYPTPYLGPTVLALYDDPADLEPRDSDQPEPTPALQAALPTSENRILLIFSKTGNDRESQPRVRALGISTEKMQAGDYRVFNFSKQNAYLVMNDTKALIQPGKPVDFSSIAWKSDVIDLEVLLGVKEEKGMRKVYSSVWGHMPARRTFLFIFDREDRFNPFHIRRYYDAPPAVASSR